MTPPTAPRPSIPDTPAARWTRREWLRAAIGGGTTIAAAGLIGDRALRTARDTVTPQTMGLGAASPWERIAFLSDLHLPRSLRAVTQAAAQVAAWRPEVVILGGDIVDHPAGLEMLEEMLGSLRGTVATIALMGNWEYAAGLRPAALAAWYARRGVQLLQNARHDIGELQLVTFDDLRSGDPQWPLMLRDRPTLWLAHEPATWREVGPWRGAGATPPPMALLSGHTHGGQVALWGRQIVLPHGSDGYVRGWYRAPASLIPDATVPLGVSAGVGTSTIPIRWGSPAEWSQLTRSNRGSTSTWQPAPEPSARPPRSS